MRSVGYHFTSKSNWDTIKYEGLQCYNISEEKRINLRQKGVDCEKGIWLWERKLDARETLGCCIYQFERKGDLEIVELEINFKYIDTNILFFNNKYISIKHNYYECKNNLHDDTPAVLAIKNIKPEEIKLVRVYNLLDCVK